MRGKARAREERKVECTMREKGHDAAVGLHEPVRLCLVGPAGAEERS